MKIFPLFFLLATTRGPASAFARRAGGADPSTGEGEAAASGEWKKPTPLTSSRVQRQLDQLCAKRFQELCTNDGLQLYCGKTAVARKGRGSALQEQKEWRCYDDAALSESSADMWCTDDCGVLFPCVGSVDPQNSIHTTVESLGAELVDKVAEHCSPHQKILNDYCTNLKGNWVARRGVSRGGGKTPWRCYDVGKLDYNLSSDCLNNCGKPGTCRGGRARGEEPLVEEIDYVEIEEAQRLLDGAQTCDVGLVCVRTLKNPPKCVTEKEASGEEHITEEEEASELKALKEPAGNSENQFPTPLSVLSLFSEESRRPPKGPADAAPTPDDSDSSSQSGEVIESLQHLLDARCAQEFEWLCKEKKLLVFCDARAVVARKDMGVGRGEPGPLWRCVMKVDMQTSGKSFCVDNCGIEYPCPGHFDPTTTVHAKWPGIVAVIEENQRAFCGKQNGYVRLDEA
ncbi:microneme protein 13 [Cystoisospora suis]|uniref:Microneme protein 13 n=1 Tax=Cystoisospora suis TaxID=483139 RepID=A0A2C6L7A7_9APIC|nr:microneme protein 13 [Cystoisospora suis]